MQIIDMTPYDKEFTKLERLDYERNAIAAVYRYVQRENKFTDEEVNRIKKDYFNAITAYDIYFNEFKQELSKTLKIQGIDWNPDFIEREMHIN